MFDEFEQLIQNKVDFDQTDLKDIIEIVRIQDIEYDVSTF